METNTAYYRLEKSSDGKHFETANGRIDPMGSASEGYEYEFDDSDDNTTVYYRVVTIDKNNKQTISNLAIIQNDKPAQLFVLNNPARGDVRLKINGSGEFRLTLMNETGQTVYQTTVKEFNSSLVTIPAAQLAKGVYWLSSTVENKKMATVKILIQ